MNEIEKDTSHHYLQQVVAGKTSDGCSQRMAEYLPNTESKPHSMRRGN